MKNFICLLIAFIMLSVCKTTAQYTPNLPNAPNISKKNNNNPCDPKINVRCSPEGDDWQVEKRAVAKIYRPDGTPFCTGTLLI